MTNYFQCYFYSSFYFSYHSIWSNPKELSSNSHRLQVRTFFWGWLCTHARHMSVMKGTADLSHQGLVFTIIKHNGYPLSSTIIIKHHQSVSLSNTIIHHYQTLLFASINDYHHQPWSGIIINHSYWPFLYSKTILVITINDSWLLSSAIIISNSCPAFLLHLLTSVVNHHDHSLLQPINITTMFFNH